MQRLVILLSACTDIEDNLLKLDYISGYIINSFFLIKTANTDDFSSEYETDTERIDLQSNRKQQLV